MQIRRLGFQISQTSGVLVAVVDDEESTRLLLEYWLRRENYEVACYSDATSFVESLGERLPTAVCLDISMPPYDGLVAMEKLHRIDPDVPVIFTTARTDVETVVNAMRQGAFDYQTKPLEPNRLLLSIRNAVQARLMQRELSRLKARLSHSEPIEGLVGISKPMLNLFNQIRKVAESDVSVMILGESGTGKELVARAIHLNSPRAQEAFVDLNCAAIPETLIESELFGHEKGAFTGALATRKGRFERAEGGTLFLDEIAEMNLSTQVRLLRVLQERRFERVGGNVSHSANVRIVSATHRPIDDLVARGLFRQDLYYRLMVFPITVPNLRDRPEDIPALVPHFIHKHGRDTQQSISVDPAAMDRLMGYDWPGNVRELENAIQYALVSAEGNRIRIEDLPPLFRGAGQVQKAAPPPPSGHTERTGSSMADAEREAIVRALKDADGNISRASERLGIGRTTLYRKMRQYGLETTKARSWDGE